MRLGSEPQVRRSRGLPSEECLDQLFVVVDPLPPQDFCDRVSPPFWGGREPMASTLSPNVECHPRDGQVGDMADLMAEDSILVVRGERQEPRREAKVASRSAIPCR